jgi:phytoene dehydrogenase-like protein
VAEVLKENGRATGVRLDTSEVIEASAVVLATDGETAGKLSGLSTVEGHTSSICLYYETATPCVDGAYVVLNGSGKGIVNEVAPITNAAPGYAPYSKHLAAVTILGDSEKSDQELAAEAQKELEGWFPHRPVNMWRFIRAYRVRYAQMAQPKGIYERLPKNATNVPGLFFAGEFTTNASIDGALKSGADCAAVVLAERQATEAA